MGVTFSDSDSTFKNGAIDRNCLRVDKATVEAIVSAFVQHSFPPVGNKDELMSLFHCAVSHGAQIDTALLLDTCWQIFQENEICSFQEILACMVLICDTDWAIRLEYIFDIFKSACTNDIGKEDIALAAEVINEALQRLWGTIDREASAVDIANNREELQTCCDGIATGAFVKLSRAMDEGIRKEEFVNWGMERFKPSKTVANKDTLIRIYMAV